MEYNLDSVAPPPKPNLFKRFFSFVTSPQYSRTFSILVVLLIAAAIPLTAYFARQPTRSRQQAAGSISIVQDPADTCNSDRSFCMWFDANTDGGNVATFVIGKEGDTNVYIDVQRIGKISTAQTLSGSACGHGDYPHCWKFLIPNSSLTSNHYNVTFGSDDGQRVSLGFTATVSAPPTPTPPTPTPTPVLGPLNVDSSTACVAGDATRQTISVTWDKIDGARSYLPDLKEPGGSVGGINCVDAGTKSFTFPNNYPTSKTYTVHVTAFSEANCASVIKTESDRVTNATCITPTPGETPPVGRGCTLTANPSTGGAPLATTITLSPDSIIKQRPGDFQQSLTFGDGQSGSFSLDATATHTYQEQGDYTVSFTGTSEQEHTNYTCTKTVRVTSGDASPTLTPTPQPGGTKITLNLVLAGIGQRTDRGPQARWNPNPTKTKRDVTIYLYEPGADTSNDADGQRARFKPSGTEAIEYDGSGKFVARNFDLRRNFVPGDYQVFVKTSRYLRKRIPGIQTINAGSNTISQQVTLVLGDANNDNSLNIDDYHAYLSCLSKQTADCIAKADFNDDGKVDTVTPVPDFSDHALFTSQFDIIEGD